VKIAALAENYYSRSGKETSLITAKNHSKSTCVCNAVKGSKNAIRSVKLVRVKESD
jgi:hypothetical protein